MPCSPFQITSYFWKCSTKSPVGVDVVAVDDQAGVGGVLTVQPTPVPWSARQAQMSSRTTWSLLTIRLIVALPTCGPPIRKKTSCRAVGSAALELPCAVRGCRPAAAPASVAGPASTIRPATSTPGTSATVERHGAVCGGQGRHAQPQHDGVRALDLDRPVDVVDAGREQQVLAAAGELAVDGRHRVGRRGDVERRQREGAAGVEPVSQVVPEESSRAAGTNTSPTARRRRRRGRASPG